MVNRFVTVDYQGISDSFIKIGDALYISMFSGCVQCFPGCAFQLHLKKTLIDGRDRCSLDITRVEPVDEETLAVDFHATLADFF